MMAPTIVWLGDPTKGKGSKFSLRDFIRKVLSFMNKYDEAVEKLMNNWEWR